MEKRETKTLLIGIDPDCKKSGVALWNRNSKVCTFSTLSFFALFDELKHWKDAIEKVVVEAGWENRSHWHGAINIQIAGRIGNNTGANHETGKKIVEMCEYLGIPFELARPTRSKLGAKAFQQITGIKERTNQEERDAVMLVFGR